MHGSREIVVIGGTSARASTLETNLIPTRSHLTSMPKARVQRPGYRWNLFGMTIQDVTEHIRLAHRDFDLQFTVGMDEPQSNRDDLKPNWVTVCHAISLCVRSFQLVRTEWGAPSNKRETFPAS